MKIVETRQDGTPKAVELTAYEQNAYRRYEELLDEGRSIVLATLLTYEQYPALTRPFLDWLSQ